MSLPHFFQLSVPWAQESVWGAGSPRTAQSLCSSPHGPHHLGRWAAKPRALSPTGRPCATAPFPPGLPGLSSETSSPPRLRAQQGRPTSSSHQLLLLTGQISLRVGRGSLSDPTPLLGSADLLFEVSSAFGKLLELGIQLQERAIWLCFWTPLGLLPAIDKMGPVPALPLRSLFLPQDLALIFIAWRRQLYLQLQPQACAHLGNERLCGTQPCACA